MIAAPKTELQEMPEPRAKYYVLIGRKVVPCSMEQWASPFESSNRHVGDTTVGGVRVSTLFLGLDHNWSPDGPPLIFETMVFGGAFDQEQDRYSTWEEAEQGHADFVHAVRRSQSLGGRVTLLQIFMRRWIRSVVAAVRGDAARTWRWIRSCWR